MFNWKFIFLLKTFKMMEAAIVIQFTILLLTYNNAESALLMQ